MVADFESGRMAAAAIDIPIGLAGTGRRRACDVEARRLIGPRRSSVFPAPVRTVLGAATYDEACAALARRLRAGDLAAALQHPGQDPRGRPLQSPRLQARLFEMHPELSFTVLAGAPMQSNKRTPRAGPSGRRRCGPCSATSPRLAELVDSPPAGASATTCSTPWSAPGRPAATRPGAHLQLGGERDERGLRMEMIA